MKVLLLGGTGAMGSYMVEILEQRKNIESIWVTSRKYHEDVGIVHWVQGNARDNIFLKALLSENKFDVIVDFMSYKTREFDVRVELLLESTKQYIFLSSSRVYADSSGHFLKEDSPRLLDVINDDEYLKSDEYALTKARQENILFNHTKSNWTIIRPYITYGVERLQLGIYEKEQWLYRVLRGKPIIFSRDIADRYTTLTWGYDVSSAIVELMGEKRALGQSFHITGNSSMKWNEILQMYEEVLYKVTGKEMKVVWRNKALVSDYQYYQYIYDRLYDRIFDNTKIQNFTKNISYMNDKNKLAACLEEFLEEKNFKTINWVNEAIVDKLTNCTEHISNIPGIRNKIKYYLYRFFPILYKRPSVYKFFK